MKIKKKISYFKSNIIDVIYYVSKAKAQRDVFYLTIIAVSFAMMSVVTSFYYGKILNYAMEGSEVNLIILALVIYSIARAVLLVIRFISDLLSGKIRQHFMLKFRQITLESLVDMDYESFQKNKIGDLVGKIQENTLNLAENLGLFLPEMIRRILVSLLSIIVLFIINPLLSLVFLLIVIMMTYMQVIGGYQCDEFMSEMINASNERNALYYDLIKHDKAVQVFEMNNYVDKWLSNKINKFIKSMVKAMTLLTTVFSPARIASDLSIIIPCCIGCILTVQGNMSLQEFITAVALIVIAAEELNGLNAIYANLPTIITNGNDIKRIWNAHKEELGNIEVISLDEVPVVIEQCNFKYNDTSKYILSDVNISIKHGEKIAVVGKNGSGKSTLLKIIAGMYYQDTGYVKLWSHELQQLSKATISRHVGYVSQDLQLFQDSIYNNLVIDQEGITDERLEGLLRSLGLEKYIRELNTVVSEFETNISGGEKQRMVLVRTLLRSPQLLLLDEVTSALDVHTEAHVNDLLVSLPNITIVSILHKLYLAEKYDRIIVFDEGKIVEDGTYSELMNEAGLFFNMITHKEIIE